MSWAWLPRWLVTLAIVVIVVIVLALIVGALGGFQWLLQVGHFHLDVGVTKALGRGFIAALSGGRMVAS